MLSTLCRNAKCSFLGRVLLPVVLSTRSNSIPRSSPFGRRFPPFPCRTLRFSSEIQTTAGTCHVSGAFFGNACSLSTYNLAEVTKPRQLRLRLRSLGPLGIGDIYRLGFIRRLGLRESSQRGYRDAPPYLSFSDPHDGNMVRVRTRITELLRVIRFLVLSEADITEETLDVRTCTHSHVTHSSSQSCQ